MESISKNSSNLFQCINALEVSLSIEKQGFIFYDKAAKSATDPRVRDVFLYLANKVTSRKSGTESFIKNEILGKVSPVPRDDKNESHIARSDFEALTIGIDAEMRSIEVLNQLIASEKKVDVRMIFNHPVGRRKKTFGGFGGDKKGTKPGG